MWLEFIVYRSDGSVLFESGDIAEGELEEKPADDPDHDRNLALFQDRIYDANGRPAHMFWDAAPSDEHPDGYRSRLLPAMTEAMTAHSIEVHYQVGSVAEIARVTARLRIRPIGMDVLEDLVSSGDLDPALLSEGTTFTIHGAAVEWTPERRELRSLWPDDLECPQAYLCLLDRHASECAED
jgi:hypothetical protein